MPGKRGVVASKAAQSIISKAALALGESVGEIINSDDEAQNKQLSLAQAFAQCESHLKREFGLAKSLGKGPLEREERRRRQKYGKVFEDVAKASRDRHVGHHGLAAAVVEHTLDRLGDLRRRHGFALASPASLTTRCAFLSNVPSAFEALNTLAKAASGFMSGWRSAA
jgi:hypothetical protein